MLSNLIRHGAVALHGIRYNSTYLDAGDVTGYLISVYTDPMGDLFLGIVMLTIFAGLYIRTQSLIYPAIVWILVGSALELAIPTGAMSIGKGLIILAIGALLYWLFMGRQN